MFSKLLWLSLLVVLPVLATPPKVVVVGAGLAGLTTAYRLQQKGMQVHVYEARNRVGGRVFTALLAGKPVELGAQSVADGGEAQNLHALIDEFGLELLEQRFNLDNHFYFTEGKFLSTRQLLQEKHFDPETLHSDLVALSHSSPSMQGVLNGLWQPEDPLYKILRVRLAAYEGGPVETLSSFYIETLYHMLLGGLSSVHQATGEEEPLHLFTLKEGNSRLPAAMAQALGENVHLNMPLVSVSKTPKNSYLLTFQSGERVEADILVLAIPCSVYANISFGEEVIPKNRLEAFRNVHYGTNAKILLSFPKPPSSKKAFMNDRAIAFLHGDKTFMTLFYTGEAGRFSPETIEETYEQEHRLVQAGFGEESPPFATPAIARDELFASYEQPVGHSWPNDPYAKGSYSYIAAGQDALFQATQEEAGEIVKTLFAPIDQTLYFVGEHATILPDVGGTMEAACESGERTARIITNPLRK